MTTTTNAPRRLDSTLKPGDTFDNGLGTVKVLKRLNFNDTYSMTCRLLLSQGARTWSVEL